MRRRTRTTVLVTLLVVAGALAAIVALLVVRQDSLIYFPRSYAAGEIEAAESCSALEFVTDQGSQTAFLLPPRAPDSARTLWVVFGGNASLALHWLEFARSYPDVHTAFLLVDYPGYGRSEGHPSPETIRRAGRAALDRALAHPALRSTELRIGVLGHSLGAAAALQVASDREVSQVMLLAPFTSMLAMARRTVGRPLAQLLRHRFDNRARLAEVLDRFPATRVTIIHGTRDEVIPVSMGRELAASAPERIEYLELPDADHNTLALFHDEEIYARMLHPGAPHPPEEKPG